ncbi:MAG: MFS transporter [SAR324 cluster bacterium]|nr:MFS transporter [SAR324 cluster bacterium]
MTTEISHQEKSSKSIIFWICIAEILTMQGVFTFSSMLPFFLDEWKLDGVDAGWISGIYYGSYMISVMVLVSITDWIDAKKIYITGVLITLVSCVGFALFAEGFWSAMLFRALGGTGLAGTYMPGLKALTDRLSGTSRARATSFYTSSFGAGSAVSFLIGGSIMEWFPWQTAFWIAGICSLLALLIVSKTLENRPIQDGDRSGLRSLDFRPVLRNTKAMGWIACYSTHNYELFAFRSWIVVYLTFALSGVSSEINYQPSIIVFLGILLGMISSIIGNELAMRLGRTLVVVATMFLSAVLAVVIGNSIGLSATMLVMLVLVYGCFVTGDSASITTGLIESSVKDNLGVTMAVHSSLGFIGSFLGPIGFGIALNTFGGHKSSDAWFWAFSSTGFVLIIGPLILLFLQNVNNKKR